MDDLDDVGGEEEVDYDFNLDDDFDEGGDEPPPDPATPPPAGTEPQAGQQTEKTAGDPQLVNGKGGESAQPAEPATGETEDQQNTTGGKEGRGRQRIPVPTFVTGKPRGDLGSKLLLPGKQSGLEDLNPDQEMQALKAAETAVRQGQRPYMAGRHGQSFEELQRIAMERGQGRGQGGAPGRGMDGRGMRGGRSGRGMGGRGMQGPRPNMQQMQGPGFRPNMRPPQNRPLLQQGWPQQANGMHNPMQNAAQMQGMRMGQGHPGGMAHGRGPQRPNMVRGQGLPNPAFLPMPPGLPMPGMMGPMMGMGPSASGQRGGHQEDMDDHDEGKLRRFLASKREGGSRDVPPFRLPQPPNMGHLPNGAGRDRGRGGGEWEEGSGRKGLWDRLKAPPQLAGDFDAGDEFEAPQKRRIPENAMPLAPGFPRPPPQQQGLFLPPMMNGRGHPGLPMPDMMLPPMESPREKAAKEEKAKQAAEEARKAEIMKRVAAQREENALLVRLRELEKQVKQNQMEKEMEALKANIAKLEAEAKLRQAGGKAAAASPASPPANKALRGTPGSVASPPTTKSSQGKRKTTSAVEEAPAKKRSRSPDSDSDRPAPRGRGTTTRGMEASPVPRRSGRGLSSAMERERARERDRPRSRSPPRQPRNEDDLRYLLQSKRARRQDEPEKMRSGRSGSGRRHS